MRAGFDGKKMSVDAAGFFKCGKKSGGGNTGTASAVIIRYVYYFFHVIKIALLPPLGKFPERSEML